MSVSRNTLHNIAGATVPLIVALVTVPLYLRFIGEARFGALSIVWVLLGYFGLFDLGLSRATANSIARLNDAPVADREEVFWSACAVNLALGFLGGLCLYLVGKPALGQWLKMTPALHVEAVAALPWIAGSVPIATLSGVLAGVLEGRQRFAVVNLIQATGTILFQVVPLLAAVIIGPQLPVIIPVAVIVRALSMIPFVFALRSALPLRGRARLRFARVRELLGYGAWVTVSNVIGPVLDSLDRLLIGVVLGAAFVPAYTVPFSLVARTQVLARALSRTLFPYLSAEPLGQARNRVLDSVVTMGALMIPFAVVGMFALRPFLVLWMGPEFAVRAAPVGEMLLCGMWLNGLASIPLAMLQAQGRPDTVAKFHVLELPPFVVLLWFALRYFGLTGAAFAWVIRATIDAILLTLAAGIGSDIAKRLAPGALLVFCAWVVVRVLGARFNAAGLLLSLLFTGVAAAWSFRSSSFLRHRLVGQLTACPRRIFERHERE